jgi:hypothetical protein
MPEQMTEMFRPVLFVGAGSTGARIVSMIKNRIEASGDRWTRDFYLYLNVTSEIAAEPGVDLNCNRVSLAAPGPPATSYTGCPREPTRRLQRRISLAGGIVTRTALTGYLPYPIRLKAPAVSAVLAEACFTSRRAR